MAILTEELKFYKSFDTNSTGGVIDTNQEIVNASLNNLFDSVTPTEAEDGAIEYRKFFIKNTNGVSSFSNAAVWIEQLTESADDEIQIGLGGASDNDPTAISFSQPTTRAAGLVIPTLGPGASQAIWVKRTVSVDAAPFSANNAIISIEGETG